MKKLAHTILIFVFASVFTNCGSAIILSTPIENIDKTPLKIIPLTETEEKAWSHMDLVKDTVPGMSVNRAYGEIIKNKKGQTVIVAVIDSGIDIDHEDLQASIWVNEDEIPNNNKDDDNNGYIDDVHGWNFLGETYHEQFEYVRLLVGGNTADPNYERARREFNKEYRKNLAYKSYYEEIIKDINKSDKVIADYLDISDYTMDDLSKIESEDENLLQHVSHMESLLGDDIKTVNELREIINHGLDQFNEHLDFHLNKSFVGRKTGDNPDDISQTSYGNANVKPTSKEESHGTHVAGIIAATRNNGKGANGVSNNVRIMSLRAVPDGDEYDKDIALAIRYAADNGAKIINMSFGKYYSPHKEWVHDAIVYAAQKDVLIVSGAGNEKLDLDKAVNYPNDHLNRVEIADNYITVGATGPKYGSGIISNFSNYGKTTVDVFAPGTKIHSTFPENTYKSINGTSMASPAVAGIAALIRSYNPNLSAPQVKEIIMLSGLAITSKVMVPGDSSRIVPFGDLSRSSKLVNAYNALIMAAQVLNK